MFLQADFVKILPQSTQFQRIFYTFASRKKADKTGS